MTTVNVDEPLEQVAARVAAENNITEAEARMLIEEINRLLADDAAEVQRRAEVDA